MQVMESSQPRTISIPPEAEQFIRLQRTHYPDGQPLAEHFNRDIRQEFATLHTHLPPAPRCILDIGCGVGGIDIPLFEHYGRPRDLQFYLLDKTSTTPQVYYGFQARGAYYNSLAITRKLLESNGIPAASIHLLEATDDCRITLPGPLDLVISLLSWGYHYPVETYLPAVHRLLAPGGTLILDVRENTAGEKMLATLFPKVTRIWEGNSAWRVVAVK